IRDDAHEPPVFDYRQRADVLVPHLLRRLHQDLVRRDGDEPGFHDLLDLHGSAPLRRAACRHTLMLATRMPHRRPWASIRARTARGPAPCSEPGPSEPGQNPAVKLTRIPSYSTSGLAVVCWYSSATATPRPTS